MTLKTEEIVTAIELLVENNQGLFTIPQLTKFFLPETKGRISSTSEYNRNFRFVTALHERGDLVKHDPLPGTYTPLFSLSPNGINRENLDSVCPARSEKTELKAKERSAKFTPKPEKPQIVFPPMTVQKPESRAIPLMDEIYKALVEEFKLSPEGITLMAFHSHFPNSNLEDLRLRLNVMESEDMVKSTKIGITKFYKPIQTERPLPLPSTRTPRKEIKKALGFGCEVCDALVGARAQPAIHTVTCNSCGTIYMVEHRTAYRLNLGISIQVWTPGNGEGRSA